MVLQSIRGAAYSQSNSRTGLGDTDGTAVDSGEGSSNRGMRGRGSRLNSARKAVFQPTVRAPPLGMQGQGRTSSDASRGHVEAKAGHSGLVLVNRKPTPTSTTIRQHKSTASTIAHGVGDESSMDSSRVESDCSAGTTMSNPWARRLQTQSQQTVKNSSKLVSSVSRQSVTTETELADKASLQKSSDVSVEDAAAPYRPAPLQKLDGRKLDTKTDDVGQEHRDSELRHKAVSDCADAISALDIADGLIERVVPESRTINPPQPAPGISKQYAPTSMPTAVLENVDLQQQQSSSISACASDVNDTGKSAMSFLPAATGAKESSPTMDIERADTPLRGTTCIDDTIAPLPSKSDPANEGEGLLPANHTWGSKVRTTVNKSALLAAEPSKSRWWKASLSGGTRKAETSLHPETQKSTVSTVLPSPPASSSPKLGEMYRSDDGESRSQSAKCERGGARAQRGSRRAQAPVPTVVPPVVLARAAARTLEPKPISGADIRTEVGLAGVLDANSRDSGTAVATSSEDAKAMDLTPRLPGERNRQHLADNRQAETSWAKDTVEIVAKETAHALPAREVNMTQMTNEDCVSKAVDHNGVAEKDALLAPSQEAGATSKSKKRLTTNGAMQLGSWRSSGSLAASKRPQSQDPELAADSLNLPLVVQKVEEKPDGLSALQRRGSSSARGLTQAPQPSVKRERGRAATSSMAATASSWRADSNRTKNDSGAIQGSAVGLSASVSSATFLPANNAVLSNGAVIPQLWTSNPIEQQPITLNGGVLAHSAANRESSATQGIRMQSNGDAYYASAIGLRNSDVERGRFANLLHFSEPQSRSTRIALSPPLLPHTMLADILGEGEHTSSSIGGPQLTSSISRSGAVAVSAELSDTSMNTNTVVNASLVRSRRISSVIGIRAQGETEGTGSRGLDYGSRVRSSSSLFDANRSSSLATGSGTSKSHLRSGFVDSGLLMRSTQNEIASAGAEFGYLPVHDPPPSQSRSTQPTQATSSNGRLWDHSSVLSTQATGHPLYADNTGGIMFGEQPTSTFSAFSSGAAMLWPEPAARPLLSHEDTRPPSREDSGGQHIFAQSGRTPRPIGTRGASGSSGVSGTRDKHGPAQTVQSIGPAPLPLHQQQMWQLHFPMQPHFQPFPHAYSTHQHQYQQHVQLIPEPENYHKAASAPLNGFGEMSGNGSHSSLPLGLIASQQQSGTVNSASPLVYPYAYPGGHPMVPAYHAQQLQHYAQYTSTPLSVHEGPVHMAMMPIYGSHADSQVSGSMVQHPTLTPMNSQSNNVYVPSERWPDNQSAYLKQSLSTQQVHGYAEAQMPIEDVVHTRVSVEEAQQSDISPSAAPAAESKGTSPVRNTTARNTVAKPQRVRNPKEQKPRGGGGNNSERRPQNKAIAATSGGSDPNQGAERSVRAPGGRRSSRADRGRKPSKSNVADAAGEDKPQTTRRSRGTHHRSGASKQSTAVASGNAKD
ncbi:hypothetical protein H4S08_003516 [Coemansia sp. RSA 1365]|nr:hypothetical protein H4S08_003516 [Coemansia sp. RSA 1365]